MGMRSALVCRAEWSDGQEELWVPGVQLSRAAPTTSRVVAWDLVVDGWQSGSGPDSDLLGQAHVT